MRGAAAETTWSSIVGGVVSTGSRPSSYQLATRVNAGWEKDHQVIPSHVPGECRLPSISVTHDLPLPLPYSNELVAALKRRGFASQAHQHVYACLYERRGNPPTDREIGDYVADRIGVRNSQLQRRRRDLKEVFFIENLKGFRYHLIGWLPEERAESKGISQKVRFRVLQSGACKNCGRTVSEDDIKLAVDHILPQAWGGSDAEENLQPLCTDCNGGKKDYYGQFDQYAQLIQKAASFEEPHRRIAMLLRAFNGGFVPSELLGAVASVKQYQEDWQKRTRELRELGIDYTTRKRKLPSGRVVSDYALTKWADLPDEPLATLIRRLEREKKAKSPG